MDENRIRILIVDDHAVVRKGLAMVLRLEPDLEVVGEAGDRDTAIEMAQQLQPEVVILDRVVPGMNVIETIQTLRQVSPDSRLIILTGTEFDHGVTDILSAGVDGYVLKDIQPQDLKQAIRIVAKGDAYLHPAVTRHVMDRISVEKLSAKKPLLTPREMEILRWMATTATYREIAKQLTISEETVRSHSKHILSKLGQPNREMAVREASRKGLIDLH